MAASRTFNGFLCVFLWTIWLVNSEEVSHNTTVCLPLVSGAQVEQRLQECQVLPRIPKASNEIMHVLNEKWEKLDRNAGKIMESFKNNDAFMQFSHARQVFKDHLVGTFALLAAWGQPEEVARTGLFHTGYSGDLFRFFFWDASDAKQREELREIVGVEAEALIWRFGTINRGAVLGLSQIIAGNRTSPPVPLQGGMSATIEVPHRLSEGKNFTITNGEAAKIMVVTAADYLDQMVEVNGWRDHHQVEVSPRLYPSNSRPATALYWISAICHAVRNHLDVIPPIFDQCQSVIAKEDEEKAADAYWSVVAGEMTMAVSEQIHQLESSIGSNPWVGEPHVLLAQIKYRSGDFVEAANHCAKALEKFYQLSAAWDKRLDFKAWVAYARLLLLRSTRRARGLSSMPERHELPPTSGGMPLISIHDLLEAM